MTYRDQCLQAEIAARRFNARRRATTERQVEASSATRWLWWVGGLAGVAVGVLSLM